MNNKRQELRGKMERNNSMIEALEKENKELYYEDLLLSDENRRYIEEVREVVISKRPKQTKTVVYGLIQWDEKFPDGDTGEVYVLQRHRIVREDGEWVV